MAKKKKKEQDLVKRTFKSAANRRKVGSAMYKMDQVKKIPDYMDRQVKKLVSRLKNWNNNYYSAALSFVANERRIKNIGGREKAISNYIMVLGADAAEIRNGVTQAYRLRDQVIGMFFEEEKARDILKAVAKWDAQCAKVIADGKKAEKVIDKLMHLTAKVEVEIKRGLLN